MTTAITTTRESDNVPASRPTPGGAEPLSVIGGARTDPAPLGFGAFAANTFMLCIVNTGLVDASLANAAVATSWVFGGVIQIIVAVLEIMDRRTFPAVAFGTFGAFWMSYGLFNTIYVHTIPAGSVGTTTAVLILPFAVITAYLLVGATRTNLALLIGFALVEATLIPLDIGLAGGFDILIRISGWAGLVLSALMWHIAAAGVLSQQFGREVLPVGHLTSRLSRRSTLSGHVPIPHAD